MGRTAWDTLVPWQIEHGRQINESWRRLGTCAGSWRLRTHGICRWIVRRRLCAGEQLLCAWREQIGILRECHRLLRAGRAGCCGRWILGPGKLRGPQKLVCRKLCDCWAIETLGAWIRSGAKWNVLDFGTLWLSRCKVAVAPSVLHVPWVTVKFLPDVCAVWKPKMTRARWNNVLAPILAAAGWISAGANGVLHR